MSQNPTDRARYSHRKKSLPLLLLLLSQNPTDRARYSHVKFTLSIDDKKYNSLKTLLIGQGILTHPAASLSLIFRILSQNPTDRARYAHIFHLKGLPINFPSLKTLLIGQGILTGASDIAYIDKSSFCLKTLLIGQGILTLKIYHSKMKRPRCLKTLLIGQGILTEPFMFAGLILCLEVSKPY